MEQERKERKEQEREEISQEEEKIIEIEDVPDDIIDATLAAQEESVRNMERANIPCNKGWLDNFRRLKPYPMSDWSFVKLLEKMYAMQIKKAQLLIRKKELLIKARSGRASLAEQGELHDIHNQLYKPKPKQATQDNN